MIPIHELLNRIRGDAAFAQGRFVIGYYDRVDARMIQVPVSRVQLTPGDHFAFHVPDADGTTHEVPFHRVKAVYKNGGLIWHREHQAGNGAARPCLEGNADIERRAPGAGIACRTIRQ